MRLSWILSLACISLAGVVAASCEAGNAASKDTSPSDEGGGSGATLPSTTETVTGTAATSAGAGTSSATGFGGTNFTMGQCVLAADCPTNGNPCEVPNCKAGVCGFLPIAAGTPTPSQLPGDCVEIQCDGTGKKHKVPISDPPNAGNPCIEGRCEAGVPVLKNKSVGTPCSTEGGHYCDAAAQCVACTQTSQCPKGDVCDQARCVPSTCTDGTAGENETDLNCGGACAPCADDSQCTSAADCESGVCTLGTCQVPTCTDGIQNGEEAGPDCGAACPNHPCAVGTPCTTDDDSATGVCFMGICQPATCFDTVKNGLETDVDCGGDCAPCPNFYTCAVNADCATKTCVKGTCYSANCINGVQDADESDKDCGGASCPQCQLGMKCGCYLDCQSLGCCGGKCDNATACIQGMCN